MDEMNIEYESIFVESSEDIGVMYKSYEPIIMRVSHFIDILEKAIDELNSKGSEAAINIKGDITQLKQALSVKITPSEINIRKVKATIQTVKKCDAMLQKLLERLSKLKDKIAYGGNFIRGIIKKPIVYNNNNDNEAKEKTNAGIREVNRGVDWVEKALIDLFNLVDQDLNILTIVDKIYVKNHIFEGVELPAAVVDIEEDSADIIAMLPQAEGSDMWLLNSQDKKTGSAPSYLSDNHNMARWGEGDDSDKSDDKKDEEDKSLKDYERPSAKQNDSSSSQKSDESEDEDERGKSSSGSVYNYYNYTYTNSLNKNRDSFNRSDNHSRYDSHNVTKTNDDHSTGKHINSHNNSDESDKEKSDYHKLESAPWELNIGDKPFVEDVGDADDDRPTDDTPVRNVLLDTDRNVQKGVAKVKKAGNDLAQTYKAATKGIKRGKDWINKTISDWKDADQREIKERLADPEARHNIFALISDLIKNGSYLKAGLLLNPIILGLYGMKKLWGKKSEGRLRAEMIGELKAEIEVIDEKIADARKKGDDKAKYQLMRFKNEINKKLVRVAGGKQWSKLV